MRSMSSIDPQAGWSWIIIAVLVVNGLTALGGLVAMFATRRELIALERRVEKTEVQVASLPDMLHTAIHGVGEASEHRNQSISQRIDTLAKEFGEAIRGVPAQVIAILANTGAIKR